MKWTLLVSIVICVYCDAIKQDDEQLTEKNIDHKNVNQTSELETTQVFETPKNSKDQSETSQVKESENATTESLDVDKNLKTEWRHNHHHNRCHHNHNNRRHHCYPTKENDQKLDENPIKSDDVNSFGNGTEDKTIHDEMNIDSKRHHHRNRHYHKCHRRHNRRRDHRHCRLTNKLKEKAMQEKVAGVLYPNGLPYAKEVPLEVLKDKRLRFSTVIKARRAHDRKIKNWSKLLQKIKRSHARQQRNKAKIVISEE